MRPMSVALTAAALVSGLAGAARAEQLQGDSLLGAISGKRVFLATPLGGEFPLNYRANGVVDGSGEAVGLGRFMQPTDSGRWWVDGAKLCQKWRSWYNGKQFCFSITSAGPGKITWARDDGLTGTARIEP
ncbi:hypothetical protein [Methylopila turkensis]|uniref:Dihydrodipicolinate reductase n=1 Tax=Methylopila turkensis TaxID=1437816 RepID=A0A9W6JNN6_9HYPH|nr:hypothetical protein [Methylopila turkensis]GLK80970.1 hypothetical protein GCM10008174_27110 [Methylopila turkensis]